MGLAVSPGPIGVAEPRVGSCDAAGSPATLRAPGGSDRSAARTPRLEQQGEDAGSPNGGADQSDPPLTEDGVRQAASVARRLADVPAAGFSSPRCAGRPRPQSRSPSCWAPRRSSSPSCARCTSESGRASSTRGSSRTAASPASCSARSAGTSSPARSRWRSSPSASRRHRGRRRHGGGGRDGDRGRARRGDRRGVPAGHGQPRVRVPLRRELLDHPDRAHAAGPLGAPGLQ